MPPLTRQRKVNVAMRKGTGKFMFGEWFECRSMSRP